MTEQRVETDAPRRAAGGAVAAANPQADVNPRVRDVGPILLVGAPNFIDHVRELLEQAGLPQPVGSARTYLAALAEAGALRPQVVIGSVDGLRELAASTATALRRLVPRVRLLLLPQPTDQELAIARRAVLAGFDNLLTQPVAPARLRDAVLAEQPIAASALATEAPLVTAPEEKTSPVVVMPTAPELPVSPEPAAVHHTLELVGAQSTDEYRVELGDTDLVEQLLTDRPDLLPVALQLLAQSAPDLDLVYAADPAATPDDRQMALVEHDGTRFGCLHAPLTTAEDTLVAWAGWLARWLALQARVTHLHRAATTDFLTGAYNRRHFEEQLAYLLAKAQRERFRVTLMIFDIDDFKHYNDTYGHPAGDDILRETARLMQSVVRTHDIVARIGGDEFAVIFWDAEAPRRPNSEHPNDVRRAAQRFQRAITNHQFPKLSQQAPGELTISGGLASFPWDGRTPAELMDKADEMALQSKRQGKNCLTFGPGASRTE